MNDLDIFFGILFGVTLFITVLFIGTAYLISKFIKDEVIGTIKVESYELQKEKELLQMKNADLKLEKIILESKIAKALEKDDGLTRIVYQYSYSTDLREEVEGRFYLRDFRYILRDSITELLNSDLEAEPLVKQEAFGKVKQSSMSFTASQYDEISRFIDENDLTKREFIDLALLGYLKNHKYYGYRYDD